jgi:MFS transporter, putative metabolite:H+ symporter
MRSPGAITFGSRCAFWLGGAACTAGVLLHLPMYFGSADMGYRMAGMRPDAPMLAGMALILAGLAATAYGLWPRRAPRDHRDPPRVQALDDARITPTHVCLLAVMAVAVTIDVMKPAALAFVTPGVAREYGLTSPLNPHGGPPVALLPLVGIVGTVIGSFLWGSLGDRIGRRASILFAGVLFITTSICGAMPGFNWNLAMCFAMGIGVGGMLPITFTLIAETIPARHRGWVMVLIGGDIAGGYVLTSWMATALVPHYSWRILWLAGLPTGVLLIALNRWIPESPRFLLGRGRTAEARAIMDRYGAAVVPSVGAPVADGAGGGYASVFRRPFGALSVAIVALGLGVGLVSFGFQLWIPTDLQRLGLTEVDANRVLRDSAILGFPFNFAVAWAYGRWSSRNTIVILSGLTTAALLGFAVLGDRVADHAGLLHALLIVPIWGISSVTAVLGAYGTEVYPTRVRTRGAGLAAGASKAGGVLIIALVAASVAAPSIAVTALLGALPMAVAAVAVAAFGVETRRRRLEEITSQFALSRAG